MRNDDGHGVFLVENTGNENLQYGKPMSNTQSQQIYMYICYMHIKEHADFIFETKFRNWKTSLKTERYVVVWMNEFAQKNFFLKNFTV